MATVVLFHSALGLTRHVGDWADTFRTDGHEVVTPDLFGGLRFADPYEAVAYVDSEGMAHWVERAEMLVTNVPGPIVYAGFSLGAAVAEVLALRDERAQGALLMSGVLAPGWFDIEEWPARLRAQLHYTRDDEWVSPSDSSALLELAQGECEEIVYPGSAHLFGFHGWMEYDAELSHQMHEHATDFLATFDE